MMTTNAELTARYNELADKNIKPNSYSKAKLEALIQTLTPTVDAVTTVDIAKRLGANPKVIRARIRRNRTIFEPLMTNPHRFPQENVDQVIELLSN